MKNKETPLESWNRMKRESEVNKIIAKPLLCADKLNEAWARNYKFKTKYKMKLLDVRIGNTVLKDGKLKNVSLFTMSDLIDFADHFKGIPLTEEWLFRYGFANTDESEFHKDWKFKEVKVRYKKENQKYLIGVWNDSDDDCQIIWLDYVHELENIFYIITKRELAIRVEAGGV